MAKKRILEDAMFEDKQTRPSRYPDHLWQMTWGQVLAAAEEKHPLVTFEGYLLCSKDRKFDAKTAYWQWRHTIKLACEKGRPVPQTVLEEVGVLPAQEVSSQDEDPPVADMTATVDPEKEPKEASVEPEEEEPSLFAFG